MVNHFKGKSGHSLPGAIAAYGLSLGIANIKNNLPQPVNALLTGLNAATVGIIALSAVQLSQKAITDKLSRILVFLGATAGMLYNALWYFPVLLIAAGCATIAWDYRWIQNMLRRLLRRRRERQSVEHGGAPADTAQPEEASTAAGPSSAASVRLRMETVQAGPTPAANKTDTANEVIERDAGSQSTGLGAINMRIFSWKLGVLILACFWVTFTVIMILRGVLHSNSRAFNLFANLFLAGKSPTGISGLINRQQ